MKVSKKVPLVHIRRLHQRALDAGCTGLVACMEQVSKSFLARNKMTLDDLFRRDTTVPKDDPVAQVAWDKLNALIEARYGESERQFEAESEDEDDWTAISRYLIQIAETVPTLPEDIRVPVDRFLGELVQQQLAA
jgi:hypothetical protein